MSRIPRIGTAGWAIPRAAADAVSSEGTHLQRYAQSLTCAEINSSFHRSHRRATYERWRESTPDSFRFAVKLPRTVTHEQKLRRSRDLLAQFFAETEGLEEKRGPTLVQLPPSLEFDSRVASRFFDVLRSQYTGPVACEPRHATWFSDRAHSLMIDYEVSRVAADPAVVAAAARPGGWPRLAYFRLHGSPRKYWSCYSSTQLTTIASEWLESASAVERWCIFDNTAGGAAFLNALALQSLATSHLST
jgi:uncharacterized protein YecE (DUF72 family)